MTTNRLRDVQRAVRLVDELLDVLSLPTLSSEEKLDIVEERMYRIRNYLDRSYGEDAVDYDNRERARELDFHQGDWSRVEAGGDNDEESAEEDSVD